MIQDTACAVAAESALPPAALPPPVSPRPALPVPNSFLERLSGTRPLHAVELVPTPQNLDRLLRLAGHLDHLAGADVTVVLTDGAGGHAAPSPEPLAARLAQLMNRQPVVTVACKTASHQALLARLDALGQWGLSNVLAVTGDYPRGAPAGGAFPLDSVQLLLAARGAGLCLGATVSPFKYGEADIWGQRLKTWKKWRAGAGYFVTQIGFDVAKLQELRLWMAHDGMADVPVLGTVFLLHAGNARLLAGGRLPGVYLPPALEALAETLVGPAGRAIARRRAALLADVLRRGLGYRGVLFCGLGSASDLEDILAIEQDLAGRDWRESYAEYCRLPQAVAAHPAPLDLAPPGAFWLYPRGDDGLPRTGAQQRADRAAYARPPAALARLHHLLFDPPQPGARLLAGLLAAGDAVGLTGAVTRLEEAVKSPLLGCQMCGDCRIAHLQYRCPEPARGCAKGLLNGPCAGATVSGQCEVDASRPCYWRLVLESALAGGGDCPAAALAQLCAVQPPRDPALRGTSSWRNFFAGRTPAPQELGPPLEA